MLRRRIILITTKIERIYGKLISIIGNGVTIIASSIQSVLAKLTRGGAASTKLDAFFYRASLAKVNREVASKPEFDPSNIEANLTDVDGVSIVEVDVEPDQISALLSEYNDSIAIYKLTSADALDITRDVINTAVANNISTDAQNNAASIGRNCKVLYLNGVDIAVSAWSTESNVDDCVATKLLIDALDSNVTVTDVRRLQKFEVKKDPISGNTKLVKVMVSSCDKPEVSAAASEQIYYMFESSDMASVKVIPNITNTTQTNFATSMANSSIAEADVGVVTASKFNYVATGISHDVEPNKFTSASADFAKNGSMLVMFAPTVNTLEWCSPILTDGTLLIIQAYDANQNNNTLEVI